MEVSVERVVICKLEGQYIDISLLVCRLVVWLLGLLVGRLVDWCLCVCVPVGDGSGPCHLGTSAPSHTLTLNIKIH